MWVLRDGQVELIILSFIICFHSEYNSHKIGSCTLCQLYAAKFEQNLPNNSNKVSVLVQLFDRDLHMLPNVV